MPGGPTVLRFSTAGLPERDRLAIMREVHGRIVMLDIEPLSDEPPFCEQVVRALPDVAVSTIAHSAIHARRAGNLLADGNDSVVLCLSPSTSYILSHLNREVTTTPGEAHLLSAADPFSSRSSAMARCLNISVPRKIMARLVPELEDAFMRPIPGDSEALRLLTGYIGILKRSHELTSPELCHAVATHLHDLLALALGASQDAAHSANNRGVPAARMRAVKADILKNLADQGLNLTVLAARHGVTPRYLQMLFESEGATFSQYLLEQRLARAHAMLADPRFAGLTVSTVAFDSGFGDLSHFNRNFRRRYGESPSDVRARHVAR